MLILSRLNMLVRETVDVAFDPFDIKRVTS